MEMSKCIKERRSIRKYTDKPVTREVFEEIVEIARYAPSWKNTQVARYILVEDEETKNWLAEHCFETFPLNGKTLKQAGGLVIVTMIKNRSGYERDGSYSTSKEDRWEMFDAGIASQTFALVAHEKGLGSVIIGLFDEQVVGEKISIPEDRQVAAIIALGYSSEAPNPPKRKEVEELVSYI